MRKLICVTFLQNIPELSSGKFKTGGGLINMQPSFAAITFIHQSEIAVVSCIAAAADFLTTEPVCKILLSPKSSFIISTNFRVNAVKVNKNGWTVLNAQLITKYHCTSLLTKLQFNSQLQSLNVTPI